MDTLRTNYGVLVPVHEYVWASPYYWRFSMGASFAGACREEWFDGDVWLPVRVEKRRDTNIFYEGPEDLDTVSWIDIATIECTCKTIEEAAFCRCFEKERGWYGE